MDLDIQGKFQQVHDLDDAGAGNKMDSGQFGLVDNLVGSEELLKLLSENERFNCQTLIHNSVFDTILRYQYINTRPQFPKSLFAFCTNIPQDIGYL